MCSTRVGSEKASAGRVRECEVAAADDGMYWVDWNTFTRVWEVYRGAVEVG